MLTTLLVIVASIAGIIVCDVHASLRTTSIYGDVVGPDERAFAERMWLGHLR